jgi:ABC-type multidrug transport system ATPase subunit
VLEAVEEIARRIRVGDKEMSASQLAEMFGFTSARQWTPVGDLSGGERRRLQLLRLLMGEPNVLILDEPTNDLDIDTLTALEDLLDSWPGTLIVVSHDRYLVERVTDNVWALMGDGGLEMLTRGIEEYLERRSASVLGARPGPDGGGAASGGAGRGGAAAGDTRAAKKELARLERQVAKLDTKEAQLHEALAQHATDYERVATLDAELRDVQAQREIAEEAWLQLSEHG